MVNLKSVNLQFNAANLPIYQVKNLSKIKICLSLYEQNYDKFNNKMTKIR
jgi:hypothetical protein